MGYVMIAIGLGWAVFSEVPGAVASWPLKGQIAAGVIVTLALVSFVCDALGMNDPKDGK